MGIAQYWLADDLAYTDETTENFPLTKITDALHSVYSASSSKRWLACPASILMSKDAESTTNPAAELGTAAHELGEWCLKTGVNAYDCIGLIFNKFVVDAQMADAVQLYVSFIRDLCRKYNVEPMLEKRVVMLSVRNDVYGTSDCIIIIGDWLFVIDYKHGYGIVEVANNSQAVFYAIATLDTLGLWQQIKHVQTTIVQPRADHVDGSIRHHIYTIEQLIQWQNVFRQAIQRAESGESPIAGEHCHYCPARGICRARMQRTIDLAYGDKALSVMNVDELIVLYSERNVIRKQLENVEQRMLEFARKGVTVDGHKLVKAITRANCSDEDGFIEAAINDSGKDKSEFYNMKLKSMTDCKKLVDKGVVDKYFVKPPASTTLVPLNDKRPAVTNERPSAVGIFEGIK